MSPFALGLGSNPRESATPENTAMEVASLPSIWSTPASKLQDWSGLGTTPPDSDYDLVYLSKKRDRECRLHADMTNLEIERLKLAGRQKERQIEFKKTQLEIERLNIGAQEEELGSSSDVIQ